MAKYVVCPHCSEVNEFNQKVDTIFTCPSCGGEFPVNEGDVCNSRTEANNLSNELFGEEE